MAANNIVEFPHRHSGLSALRGLGGLTRLSPARSKERVYLQEQQRLQLSTLTQRFLGLTQSLYDEGGEFEMNEAPQLQFDGAWPHYRDLPLPAKIHVEHGDIDGLLSIESGPYKATLHKVGSLLNIDEQHPKDSTRLEVVAYKDRTSREIAWLQFANELLGHLAIDVNKGPSLPPAA